MKAKWGMFMVDGRGKSGNHVASKNIGGAIVRTKVTPANPQTPAQMAARAALATNSQAWRGLTEEQRLSWNAAKVDYPERKGGDTIILSGQMLYNKLNGNLLSAGQSPITTAPLPVTVPDVIIEGLTADVSDTEIEVTMNVATVPVGFSLIIAATPQYSPGRYNVKNRFRKLGVFTLTTGAVDIYAAWNAEFGTLVAGQKISVRAWIVSNTTGIASVPTEFATIVAA